MLGAPEAGEVEAPDYPFDEERAILDEHLYDADGSEKGLAVRQYAIPKKTF